MWEERQADLWGLLIRESSFSQALCQRETLFQKTKMDDTRGKTPRIDLWTSHTRTHTHTLTLIHAHTHIIHNFSIPDIQLYAHFEQN